MKKIVMLISTLVLFFAFCNLAMAQVFTMDDEFSSASYPDTIWNHRSDWHTVNTWHKTDGWYSIVPESPYVEVYYNDNSNQKTTDTPRLGVEGYANEQTFFDVHTQNGNSDINYIAGSFLFENGLFIGGSYSGDSKNNVSYITPGFRLNLNDFNFVALSFEYRTSNEPNVDDEIVGYDMHYKYWVDKKTYLGGEVYLPKDGETYWWLGFNVKPADDLVLGAYYETQSNTDRYHGGFTYTPMPFIIDAEIGQDEENYYAVSGMLIMSDTLRLGADYFKYNDDKDGAIHLKLNYGNDKTNLIIKYRLKNDTYDSTITAAVQVKAR